MQYLLSGHALQRSAQRNLSDDDIDFIIQHGDRLHRTGVIFCQLRYKNIPAQIPGNHRCHKLVGTTIVLCKCGRCVVTMYREERAFRRDARKAKYTLKGMCKCGCCAPTPVD